MSSPRPGKRAIRFACRNCTTRLAAPLRAAGKTLRCPCCYTSLVVPHESTSIQRGESYGLADPAQEPVDATNLPSYVNVVCPVCATRMYTTPDKVGETMTCPDCGSQVEVQAPTPTTVEPPRHATTDEYALFRGEGQPPPGDQEVYQVYIPVICPVCHTRMLATENEVGQEMVCPDCDTRVRVPPLAKKASSQPYRRSAEEREDAYEVAGQSARGASRADRSLILVVCGVCHTRLHATPDQVGHELLCPDCYTPLIVPEPSANREIDPEAIGGYEVNTSAPPRLEVIIPGYEPVVDDGPLRRKKDPMEERRRRREQSMLRRGSRRSGQLPPLGETFFRGVFNFPFYRFAWNRWVALSGGMFLVFALASLTLALRQINDPRMQFLCAMSLVVSGLTFLAWFIIASADLLEIVSQTAGGAEEVEPSETIWLDRLLECLFPAFAFGIACLLGGGFDRVLGGFGLATPWLVPGMAFFLFPVVLLSMLHNGTPLAPISLPVFGSLLSAWRAWSLFYLLALLLGAAITVVGWLLSQVSIWLDAVALAAFQVWAMMVYSRLLGRVAWYCGQGEDEEEEEE